MTFRYKDLFVADVVRDVQDAFRCTGEHSCYSGADDVLKCSCLLEMKNILEVFCEKAQQETVTSCSGSD